MLLGRDPDGPIPEAKTPGLGSSWIDSVSTMRSSAADVRLSCAQDWKPVRERVRRPGCGSATVMAEATRSIEDIVAKSFMLRICVVVA